MCPDLKKLGISYINKLRHIITAYCTLGVVKCFLFIFGGRESPRIQGFKLIYLQIKLNISYTILLFAELMFLRGELCQRFLIIEFVMGVFGMTQFL